MKQNLKRSTTTHLVHRRTRHTLWACRPPIACRFLPFCVHLSRRKVATAMRTTTVTRRVARTTAEEEKKDEAYDGAIASSATRKATAADGPKFRRRRKKSKDRLRFRFLSPRQMKLLVEFSPSIIALILLVLFLAFGGTSFSGKSYLRWSTREPYLHTGMRAVLPISGNGIVHMPYHVGVLMEDSYDNADPYFGGLHDSDFKEDYSAREIYYDPNEHFFADFAPQDTDDWYSGEEAYYYNFDDDEKRNPYHGWEDTSLTKSRHCRRVAFHRDVHLNCLNFHALDLPRMTLENGVSFIGAGSYRDVFLVQHQSAVDRDMVLKVAEIHRDYDEEAWECMRMEGAVASHVSPNPLIVDIYGFCALSMFNEAMLEGDLEQRSIPTYHRERCDEYPDLHGETLVQLNNLTATAKLEWSLNMAEALTYLHNFHKGVIVHDDIQISQYMIKDDGRLKLGDFNRAELMLYDEEHGEYCGYRNGPGHGDWRAPEEFHNEPLNEQLDIFSLANNMYGLLTGMFPFPEECEESNVRERVMKGETPYIDPRWSTNSFAEAELVKIIKGCFAYYPADRPTIGELVLQLRKAVLENRRRIEAND